MSTLLQFKLEEAFLLWFIHHKLHYMHNRHPFIQQNKSVKAGEFIFDQLITDMLLVKNVFLLNKYFSVVVLF